LEDPAAMPAALADEASRNPFEAVGERARRHLAAAIPTLAGDLERFSLSAFGLTSGFFYLTAAQGRAWGMSDSLVTDILTIQALGHFHFAFHDSVIDEGNAPVLMCLISDVSLWSYLDGLAMFSTEEKRPYEQLHRSYYDLYAAATRRDLAHREKLSPYTTDDILGLGNKAAPGATMWHLVADLCQRPDRAMTAASAVLRLCTGLQLVDDLNDCADDAAVQNRTWPVTSALLAYPELDVTDRGAVEAAVVGSGAAAGCLKLAIHAFADARTMALTVEAAVIADMAAMWHARTTDRARLLADALTVT
jgi:hypothetical protein